jgi:hypothetical protein
MFIEQHQPLSSCERSTAAAVLLSCSRGSFCPVLKHSAPPELTILRIYSGGLILSRHDSNLSSNNAVRHPKHRLRC